MDGFEPIVKTYYEKLEEGKVMARRCKDCGKVIYPPVPICDGCYSMDTEWVELSGKATLLSGGELIKAFVWDTLKEYAPIKFGEVQLAEGPCITADIIGLEGNDVEIAAKCPIPLEMVLIQCDGFKSVAYRVTEE